MYCKLGSSHVFVNLNMAKYVEIKERQVRAVFQDGSVKVLSAYETYEEACKSLNNMMLAFENGQTVFQLN